jgi:hypothetical protein
MASVSFDARCLDVAVTHSPGLTDLSSSTLLKPRPGQDDPVSGLELWEVFERLLSDDARLNGNVATVRIETHQLARPRDGGISPVWRGDAKELFYVKPNVDRNRSAGNVSIMADSIKSPARPFRWDTESTVLR